MTKNILFNKSYSGQEIAYSDELVGIEDIEICAKVSTGSTGAITYTVQRKTENTDWVDAVDQNGNKITFKTIDAGSASKNIIKINAERLRVKVEIFSGAGTLNIEGRIMEGKPTIVDTTSETIIYEGYKIGSTYRICKLDASSAIFSRTWATGAWADRAMLNYE